MEVHIIRSMLHSIQFENTTGKFTKKQLSEFQVNCRFIEHNKSRRTLNKRPHLHFENFHHFVQKPFRFLHVQIKTLQENKSGNIFATLIKRQLCSLDGKVDTSVKRRGQKLIT